MTITSLKKESTDAIAELKRVLRRDAECMEQVKKVERYIGELRRERSALKDDAGAAREATGSSKAELDKVRAELDAMRAERDTLRSRVAGLQQDLKAAEQLLEEREGPPTVSTYDRIPPNLKSSSRRLRMLCSAVDKLKGRFGSAAPVPVCKAEVRVYSLEDFIQGRLSGEDWMMMGLFAMYVCSLHGSVGFLLDEQSGFRIRNFDQTAPEFDDKMRKMMRFFRNNIAVSPLDESLLVMGHSDGTRVSAHSRVTPETAMPLHGRRPELGEG